MRTIAPDVHLVTAEHLRRLATVDRRSLFADAGTLVDTEDGIEQVPWRVVTDALHGTSRLRMCRLMYDRSQFAGDGIAIGANPKTTEGSDLAARLAVIASGLNEDDTDTPEDERCRQESK